MVKRHGFKRRRAKKLKVSKGVKKYVKKEIMKDAFVLKQVTSGATALSVVPSNLGFIENAGYPVSISNNPGLGRVARTGNRIKIMEYVCRMRIVTTTPFNQTTLRIITVIDKECHNQTAVNFLAQCKATSNNLFENASITAAAAPDWMYNQDHVGPNSDHRFTILEDKIITFNPFQSGPAGASSAALPTPGWPITHHHTFRKKWKNGHQVNFDDNNPLVIAGDPTQISSGIIWHILISDQAAGTLGMNMIWDIRFVDAS